MRTIVLGPPGTGKTTTLLNKVDDYLKQTDPDKIGYFAFTQKAAHEARDRAIKKFNLTENTMRSYEKNPDDENRLFYVGATRTKENLHLIEPKKYEKGYIL